MQISTDIQKLKPTLDPPVGGYEWWYFDGITKDGTLGFVIILYLNNPFSTKYIKELDDLYSNSNKHPAISISLYRQQKTVYYSFLEFVEDDFSWDENKLRLSVENHSLTYSISEGKLEFILELNQELASGHSLNGKLYGKSVIPKENLLRKNEGDKGHFWNLLLPSAAIESDLTVSSGTEKEIIREHFNGYHDHNYGSEPMKESFRDWYWGRYHFKDYTLIYYLMNKLNNQQFEAWLIDKNHQKLLCSFDIIDLGYGQATLFGLKSARKIILTNEDTEATIQLSNIVDSGPFYQRFLGEGIVKYNGEVQAAQGISEYIYPKNIYNKWFWPLVHMRLRYMKDEPHWVQKSNFLYPKTW